MKPETSFRRGKVDPFLKTLKNTFQMSIQQVAIVGTPDKLLCARGRFIGLELKTDEGVVSPMQKFTLDEIERCGGVAIVARPSNWRKVKALLLKLDEGDVDVENDLRAGE